MMPPFPQSPLSSVRRVFPSTAGRLAFQVVPFLMSLRLSLHQACPAQHVGLHLPFVHSAAPTLRPALCRNSGLGGTLPFEESTPLPQRSSLRSGFYCPSPSSLTRPHPPYSPTRPNFPALRVICGALAVPAGRPRPSASSSELSLPFLLSMSPSTPPESPPTARTQSSSVGFAFVHPSLDSALSTPHFNPLHVEFTFGVSRFAHSLQPAELLASLADLTRHYLPSQRRLLLPSFRTSRSPFSPSDITTVASGHLHRQDSHLLERQLASLHERGGFELPRPVVVKADF